MPDETRLYRRHKQTTSVRKVHVDQVIYLASLVKREHKETVELTIGECVSSCEHVFLNRAPRWSGQTLAHAYIDTKQLY